MSLAREEKHLPFLIAACFAGNFIGGGIGQAMPENSFAQQFTWQWSALLYMAGASLFAAKLHTDRWHISSAGFILVSIGQGIFYTMLSNESNNQDVRTYAAGIMTYIPGMIFICYYSGFPVWLRLMGLLATAPFLVIMIQVDFGHFTNTVDEWMSPLGFFLIQLTSIFWSYFAIRPYKRVKKQN